MTFDVVRSWRWQLIVGVALIALSCALGAWVLARGDTPFTVDAWWDAVLAGSSREPVLIAFATFMNAAGGTWIGVYVVPLGGALALVIARKPWPAAYFLTASVVSAGGVQALKHLFGRARPEDILVRADFGSFPSGHTANAGTIAVVAVLLFPRVWVLVVGIAWTVLMAFSRTVLHAHWLSDTAGGALIGAGTAFAIAAAFSVVIRQDPATPTPDDAPVSVVSPPS
ncbi:phosphatase PAP2 family protein [Microbacterium sp. 10M-3C3]|jgi:undecaprenyl-diphosphatase|uniref:phosphatase PAP2 family protein n=1 Tax=Microbacterium sp. 10M-3C3 TaxID=2483401 RepID=UPI000F62E416|nr:phosphatase PAP2 family protein [Microbacterium sp. 10M-3C3]